MSLVLNPNLQNHLQRLERQLDAIADLLRTLVAAATTTSPCSYPVIVQSGTGVTPYPECEHDFYPSDTTQAGQVCRKCGKWEPSPPGYRSTVET